MSSTSHNSAKLEDIQIDISESGLTRKVLRAEIVENLRTKENTVKIALVHQRRGRLQDNWSDLGGKTLSELKASESAKFALDTDQTKALFQTLQNLYKIGENGVRQGITILEIADEDKVIATETGRERLISKLLGGEFAGETWEHFLKNNEEEAVILSEDTIRKQRETSLVQFEQNIDEPHPEEYWQDFFENNTWIFGYGLDYKILHDLQNQPNYGGVTVDNSGGQRGDFLRSSGGNTSFTTLVEIKKPGSLLLGNARYRNGAWKLGEDLCGGVSQLQTNCYTWQVEGSRTDGNRERTDHMYTINPEGILVIGDTSQLNEQSKRITFEQYRRNIYNPRIITFDELLDRAKFIVRGE